MNKFNGNKSHSVEEILSVGTINTLGNKSHT